MVFSSPQSYCHVIIASWLLLSLWGRSMNTFRWVQSNHYHLWDNISSYYHHIIILYSCLLQTLKTCVAFFFTWFFHVFRSPGLHLVITSFCLFIIDAFQRINIKDLYPRLVLHLIFACFYRKFCSPGLQLVLPGFRLFTINDFPQLQNQRFLPCLIFTWYLPAFNEHFVHLVYTYSYLVFACL